MGHKRIIETAPVKLAVDAETLGEAIHTFQECAAACTACADACLAEDDVEGLRDCITLDNVCAEICTATANVMSRIAYGSYDVLRAQLEACVAACRACADECDSHGDMHDHCRACAQQCRETEKVARELLDALPRSA
ncbi:MAG: hypothetical protein R3343_05440 [Nitriliruptorales bacterium]|nr:hypothetical protein [Nitriliruptorales bacterium]